MASEELALMALKHLGIGPENIHLIDNVTVNVSMNSSYQGWRGQVHDVIKVPHILPTLDESAACWLRSRLRELCMMILPDANEAQLEAYADYYEASIRLHEEGWDVDRMNAAYARWRAVMPEEKEGDDMV